MANETSKQPINPHGLRIPGDPSNPAAARPDADMTRSEDAPTGVSERLQAQKEGRHIPAKDPDGKPYGSDWDPDGLEKQSSRTGSPGDKL